MQKPTLTTLTARSSPNNTLLGEGTITAMPTTDWLVDFWKAAQQASPFGAMGSVLGLIVLWRAYRQSQRQLLEVTVQGLKALNGVERALDAVLNGQKRRRRATRKGR